MRNGAGEYPEDQECGNGDEEMNRFLGEIDTERPRDPNVEADGEAQAHDISHHISIEHGGLVPTTQQSNGAAAHIAPRKMALVEDYASDDEE